ncbi:MAG: hypothetical protein O2945_17655 [Planctomycetota bacterium]|nr:hypothetical protein [Planctomycetota bacterium]MDA1251468.1 hypothetical protein [Planctomycetota bacterium]
MVVRKKPTASSTESTTQSPQYVIESPDLEQLPDHKIQDAMIYVLFCAAGAVTAMLAPCYEPRFWLAPAVLFIAPTAAYIWIAFFNQHESE